MNGIDALLQSLDGGCDIGAHDACVLHQLSVISVQMMTRLTTVEELNQFFGACDEFLLTQN